MNVRPQYDGIAGLEGRVPVGAVLTVGTRDLERKGVPIENDRFWIKTRHEERKGEIGFRPPHPDFAPFNAAKPELRRSVRGNLVHAERADCFRHSYKNPKAPKGSTKWVNHPNGIPFCSGDGKTATRLYGIGKPKEGVPDDFREIACLGDLCEFRQGDVKLCKTHSRLYFQPAWAEGSPLSKPLFLYETNSVYTTMNLLGFFAYVEKCASELGLESYSLFGMPFVLTLHRMTKPSQQRSFPVVTMSPTFSPVDFFAAQRRNVALAGGRPMLALSGARSPEETAAQSEAESMRALGGEPPTLPAEVVDDAVIVEREPGGDDSDFLGDALGQDGVTVAPWEAPDDAPPHVLKVLKAGARLGLTVDQMSAQVGGDVLAMPNGAEGEAIGKLHAITK